MKRNHNQSKLFRILIVGDAAAGKTALIQKYCNRDFPEKYEPSTGADFFTPSVLQGQANLQIFDISDDYYNKRESNDFLFRKSLASQNGCAVLIVVDVNDTQAKEKFKRYIKEFKKHKEQNFSLYCVLNKVDLPINNKAMGSETLKKFAKNHSCVDGFMISAKEDIGLNEMMETVATHLLQACDRPQSQTEKKSKKQPKKQSKTSQPESSFLSQAGAGFVGLLMLIARAPFYLFCCCFCCSAPGSKKTVNVTKTNEEGLFAEKQKKDDPPAHDSREQESLTGGDLECSSI